MNDKGNYMYTQIDQHPIRRVTLASLASMRRERELFVIIKQKRVTE